MLDCMLNERQRRFAEEHHGIIESFLRSRGLSIDEYYDVVVFRFLRAVKQYDERENLRKYEFSTIAESHMCSALEYHLGKERRERESFAFLSLDYQFPDSNLTFGDVVAEVMILKEVV